MTEEMDDLCVRLDALMSGKKISQVNGMINRMSVDELKNVCKASGIPNAGCRAVLTRRLKNQARRLHFVTHGDSSVFDPSIVPVFFDCFIVVDFECTCWEDENFYPSRNNVPSNSTHVQEIIEFPAVFVDCSTMEITGEFHAYCRPVHNPKLTEYCTELTGIQQSQVDSAEPFSVVFESFMAWLREKVRGRKHAIVTDGPTDLARFLVRQCQISDVPFPKFAQRWVNIKKIFSNFFDVERMRIPQMLHFFGLEVEGRLHSGIDDARNIARLLVQLVHEGALVFPNERLIVGAEKEKAPRIYHITRDEFLNSNKKVRATAPRSPVVRRDPVTPDRRFEDGPQNENGDGDLANDEKDEPSANPRSRPNIVRSIAKNF